MSIEELIVDLSHKPFDPERNFKAAVEYEKLHQTASAVSFYLRTIEYGEKVAPAMVYASLCKLAHCFEHQKDREYTVSNALLQAIAYLPYRPEAYFLLSQFHERAQQWQEAYTWAMVGLQHDDGYGFHDAPDYDYFPALPIDVGYKGRYSLEFQQAISAYWVGRPQESKTLLIRLSQMDLPEDYKSVIEDNLRRLSAVL